MINIKKIVEFFDTDDIKSEYEIPYLKGDMPEIIKKFKDFEQTEDDRFVDAVRFQFPVLNTLNYKVVQKGSTKIHLFFASSLKHVNGDDYYASITFSFYKNKYATITVYRKLKELDKNKWEIKENLSDDIKSSYKYVNDFIKRCEEYNIIEHNDNFNLQSN